MSILHGSMIFVSFIILVWVEVALKHDFRGNHRGCTKLTARHVHVLLERLVLLLPVHHLISLVGCQACMESRINNFIASVFAHSWFWQGLVSLLHVLLIVDLLVVVTLLKNALNNALSLRYLIHLSPSPSVIILT